MQHRGWPLPGRACSAGRRWCAALHALGLGRRETAMWRVQVGLPGAFCAWHWEPAAEQGPELVKKRCYA